MPEKKKPLNCLLIVVSKRNPQNFYLLLRDYFNSLNFYKNGEYSGTKLVGVAYKLRKKMKNSPSCVHVLYKTLNLVISRCCFAEDGKEMYQNVKTRAENASVLSGLAFCRHGLKLPCTFRDKIFGFSCF